MFKLTPTSQDFGSVEATKMSASPVVFTLSNSGGGTTGTPQISVTGDFSQTNTCTSGLNASATCMISVVFKPTSVGPKSGQLVVSSSTGGMVSAALTGMGTMAGLNIVPQSHDYGPVAVGATSDAFSFNVTNTGTIAIANLAVNLNGTDFVAAAAGNKCTGVASLAPGASCTVDVQFKPTSAGLKNGTLIASGGGQTVMASVSGSGQAPAQLAITPPAQVFAGVAGKEGTPVVFTVANVGQIATGQVAVALGGADAGSFKITGQTCLAPLNTTTPTCTVSVAVSSAATAGMKSATLTASSPTGGMAVATLTANVITSGNITITPNSTDFMTVNVNGTSAAVALEVKNIGGSATSPLSVTTSTSEFVITANTCGGMALAANATCSVSVSFKPTSQGQKSALLSVSGASGELAQAMLQGTGVGVGLSISPSSPNFGSIATASSSAPVTLTVTNTGGNATGALTANLAGANASQWSIMGNNCNGSLAPAATCMVTLVFSPTTVGDKSAQLVVTGAAGGTVTADLSGSGLVAGSIQITPATPFGAPGTVIGQTSAPVTLTILNPPGALPTGALSFTLTNVAASEYAIGTNNCNDTSGLMGGNSCTVTVTFKPTVAGVRNASLNVKGAASGSGTGALQLAGIGLAALDVSPLTADFGPQSVGTSSGSATTFTFNVRGPFTTITPSVTGQFVLSGGVAGAGCGGSYAAVSATDPGTWLVCTQGVKFSPLDRTPPAKAGTFVVTGTGGTTAMATLTGTAVGPLQVTPSPGEFGAVSVGTPSTAKTFTVDNNGSVDFGPIAVVIGGANASEFAISANTCTGTPATAGSNCTFDLVLTATTAGAKTATVTVNATLLGSSTVETQTITVTGTAGTPANITASPTTLTFSSPLLTTSAAQTVTITNPGTSAVTIGAGTSSTNQFSIVTNNCTTPVAAGASCTQTVRFNPTGATSGARTATLTFSAGGTNEVVVALSGTASPTLTISPTTKDFGSVSVGNSTSTTQDFVVTNNGNATATGVTSVISAGSLINAQASDYVVVTPCAATIAANGGTCTVTVRMVPQSTGPASSTALLTVAATESTTSVSATATLSGTRVPDADLNVQFIADAAAANIRTQNLGRILVGDSRSYTATIVNDGKTTSGPLVLTLGGTNVAEFALGAGTCGTGTSPVTTTTTLAPGATCTVIVTHTPTSAASKDGSLVVTTTGHGGTTATLLFTSTAVAVAPLVVTPSPANLGAAFMGGTLPAKVTFTLTNTSGSASGTLTVTPTVVVGGAGTFAVSNDTCSTNTVPNGAVCTFDVQLTPQNTTAGYVRGYITVADGTTATNTAIVGVYGRILTDATFTHTPITASGSSSNYDFGSVVVDTLSSNATFTVTNTGERTSGPINLTLGGADSTEFAIQTSTCQGTSLAVGATCTVVVRFTPNMPGSLGDKAGQVILSASPGNSATIYVKGTAVLSALVSNSVGGGSDFGSHEVGTSTTKTVTITNRTDGQTSIVGLALSNTTDFAFGTNNCATAAVSGLAGGDSCTVDVIFTPTTIGATALSSTLTVSASPGTGSNVILQGVGAKSLSISGTATFNTTANTTRTFTISNAAGAANTGQLTTTLTGTDAALYQITGNTCTTMGSLAANGSCTVTVAFVVGSASTGTKTATLTVSGTLAGNTVSKDLTGTNP